MSDEIAIRVERAIDRYSSRMLYRKGFDPNQPRDEKGQWSDTGKSTGGADGSVYEVEARNGRFPRVFEFPDHHLVKVWDSNFDEYHPKVRWFPDLDQAKEYADSLKTGWSLGGHWEPKSPFPESNTVANELRTRFVNSLLYSDCDANARTKYLSGVHSVLKRMPKKAIDVMHAKVEGVKFFSDTMGVKHHMISDLPSTFKGDVGGAWRHSVDDGRGTLVLDGGFDGMSPSQIYAHEFGHVCDWIHRQEESPGFIQRMLQGVEGERVNAISSTPQWKNAFAVELADGKLSDYAADSEIEGFAEYARFAWTHPNQDDIKTMFPLCRKVFERHGLI